ncbi:hypothetical protein KDK95_23400 [Actinospica sp. MGRD01-02]|uniref:Uncharacterized protein n=1 Tax=Actinospica acidithermotolerans TaxID=2828514 RepID=A0A941ILP9_9ACTN|nr:hypothetical protein [Actinospica acidithermotolerans]MBR7829273.1 hypothetical protein [Actinospica acidithermotolerans]
MTGNEKQHPADGAEVLTAAIVPTVRDVSADVVATVAVNAAATDVVATVAVDAAADVVATVAVEAGADVVAATVVVDVSAEPAATQALAAEPAHGTLLMPTQADLSQADPSRADLPRADLPQADYPQATEAPRAGAANPLAAQGYRRIGPGPAAALAGSGASRIDPATAAAWHGAAPKKRRRALLRGWLMPLLVLVGVIALLLWQRVGGRLEVSGVTASAGTASIGCDSTEVVTASLHTNGTAGTIVYRWVRSDGTVSGDLRQSVGDGTKQTDVVLRWAFSGHGSTRAVATIDVESPGAASAVASFVYSCP